MPFSQKKVLLQNSFSSSTTVTRRERTHRRTLSRRYTRTPDAFWIYNPLSRAELLIYPHEVSCAEHKELMQECFAGTMVTSPQHQKQKDLLVSCFLEDGADRSEQDIVLSHKQLFTLRKQLLKENLLSENSDIPCLAMLQHNSLSPSSTESIFLLQQDDDHILPVGMTHESVDDETTDEEEPETNTKESHMVTLSDRKVRNSRALHNGFAADLIQGKRDVIVIAVAGDLKNTQH